MALDSVPAGDIAVFAICELFSLPFSFDGVERLRSGDSWSRVLLSWAIALALMLLGLTFPWIRKRLGVQVSGFLDRIVHKERFWLIVSLIIAIYVVVNGLVFMARLRSDLDMYVMPRTVTSEQSVRLKGYLDQHPPASSLRVVVVPNDQEAMEYAGRLFNALRQTSWDVVGGIGYVQIAQMHAKPKPNEVDANGRPVYKSTTDYFEAYDKWLQDEISRKIAERTSHAVGLGVERDIVGQRQAEDPKHPSPDVVLADALRDVGFDVETTGTNNNRPANAITIVVGHRPRIIEKPSWVLPLVQRFEQWLQE